MPRILLIAAIVLIVFALIAFSRTTGVFWVTNGSVWLCASILAYFTDLLLGGALATALGRRREPPA